MVREKHAGQALGVALFKRIKESKVLLVGAGGIGCELLKNLVLSGFEDVHLVDLDTIDLSNLNRQFLFRREHIKKSKALVAKESAKRFNPRAKVEAYHANIQDSRFGITFFSQFSIVFNALDNLQARRHVNKMCLAADVPLIESGTTGFNGQVQVIRKGKTECYDCNPKETPKTFPVCTIRSTPSQPIHCIVWAKSYLFNELFGTSETEPTDFDHSEDAENAAEIKKLKAEAEALKKIRELIGKEDFAKAVFQKVYQQDVDRLLGMEEMWKSRKAPTPLEFDAINTLPAEQQVFISKLDQKSWTVEENLAVFVDSIRRLGARAQKPDSQKEQLEFDKDDEDTLDFVAAASNLRSIVFGIEQKSKFDVKQMAGNIIPAIATTNAVTAGFCVLQGFKVLKSKYDEARMIFLTKSIDRFISADRLQPPKEDCAVCSVSQSQIFIDLARATLDDLVGGFLKLDLGYSDELSILNDAGEMIYDPDLDDLLPKKLSELGIKGESFLKIKDDEDESPRMDLLLSVTDKTLPSESKPVVAPVPIEVPRAPEKPAAQANGHGNGESSQVVSFSKKRAASDAGLDDAPAPASKKGKIGETNGKNGDGPILVEDDSAGGAIVIDD